MKIVLRGWDLSRVKPLDDIIDNNPAKARQFKLKRLVTFKRNIYGKDVEDVVTYNLELLMLDDLDRLDLRSIQIRNITRNNAVAYYDPTGRYTQC